MEPTFAVRRTGARLAGHALLVLFPAGGQRRARRNALTAVRAGDRLARDRAEAALALERAAHPSVRSPLLLQAER